MTVDLLHPTRINQDHPHHPTATPRHQITINRDRLPHLQLGTVVDIDLKPRAVRLDLLTDLAEVVDQDIVRPWLLRSRHEGISNLPQRSLNLSTGVRRLITQIRMVRP